MKKALTNRFKRFVNAFWIIVHSEETKSENAGEELPDEWWYRVYLAVIITTVLVLCALWAFSRYFSS
jgi:hypothetical protein